MYAPSDEDVENYGDDNYGDRSDDGRDVRNGGGRKEYNGRKDGRGNRNGDGEREGRRGEGETFNDTLRVQLTPFHGKSDLEEFLERRLIEDRDELVSLMREQFIPKYYEREMHQNLQRCVQGSRSVEEYSKELEILVMKYNIIEDKEVRITRFTHEFKNESFKVFELQEYCTYDEYVQKALKRSPYTPYATSKPWDTSTTQNTQPLNPSNHHKNTSKLTHTKTFQKSTQRLWVPPKTSYLNPSKPPNHSKDNVLCFRCHEKGHYAFSSLNVRNLVMLPSGQWVMEEEVEEKWKEVVGDEEEPHL